MAEDRTVRTKIAARLSRGESFGPPRTRRPKTDVKQFVPSLQQG